MDIIQRPPQWLLNVLPDAIKRMIENGGGGWWAALGVVGVVVLLILFLLLKSLFRRKPPEKEEDDLTEHLGEYPAAPPSTGDRRLLAEGVPVRLRLVVLAPPGAGSKIEIDKLNQTLNAIVSGLGDVAATDKPRVRIWPRQQSYEGFCKVFHNHTILPEDESETSTRWVMLAGRVKLGERQYLMGLALEAIKATTVGRRTLKAHEWTSVLRVRVRD